MAKQKPDDKLVINQLIIKSPQRRASDVGEWRNAMQSADGGRMKRLYDLFEDLLIDGILADAVSKRKDAVANAELTFQNANGEDVPEITTLIDTLEFEELIRLLLDVRFWGRTGIEFDFSNGLNVYEIPKKHINLQNKSILINDTDENGISYEGDDNILILGKNRDYGLFLKSAPFVIWKRGGFGDYAQWLEIFGMPQRVGKYSSYDPESRKLLEQALEQAGSAPWVVIPKESEVETTNNTGSGSSGTSYDDFRRACNEEMLITILGQTLTTVQGDKGARSLGEVHKAVEEGKNKSDMKFVQRVLNQIIVPVLEKRGFPVKGGSFIFPESAEELEVSEIIQLSEILEIPVSYLHDKYSIPVPKDGEPIARRNSSGAEQNIAGDNQEEETDPENSGNEKPDKKEDSEKQPKKKKLLDRFFVYAPTTWSGAASWTRKLTNSTSHINLYGEPLPEFYGIDLNKLVNRAIRELYEDEAKREEIINKNLFEVTYKTLNTAISEELLKTDDTDFIREFRHNTAVFSAFKNHLQTREMVDLLIDEKGRLRSFYEFRKLALKVSVKYNENWLRTEYNQAVRTARLAANLKEWEKHLHLYPNLEYIETTAAEPDELHLTYVGTVLPFHHPWWETHMPPSRWGCQCSVRNSRKEVTKVPEGDYNTPGFDNNPAKTAQIIELEKTPYYNNTEEEMRGLVERDAERIRKEILREKRAEATKEGRKNLGSKVTNKDGALEDIEFTVKGIKEAVNNPSDNYEAKLDAVKDIKKLIRDGKYSGFEENKKKEAKPGIAGYHYIKTIIGGREAYILIQQDKYGRLTFYSIVDRIK